MKRGLLLAVMISAFVAVGLSLALRDHTEVFIFHPRANPWIWVKASLMAYAFGTGFVCFVIDPSKILETKLSGKWLTCLAVSSVIWLGPLAWAFFMRWDYQNCWRVSLLMSVGPAVLADVVGMKVLGRK